MFMNDQIPIGAQDMPDDRDYQAEHILGKEEVEIPEEISLKLKEGNQGNSVMCTCFSAYHVAQIANEMEHGKQLYPDFDKGWELQKKFGTHSKNGDYVQTALKSVVKNGLVTNDEVYSLQGYAKIEKSEIDYWLARGYAIVTSTLVTKTNYRKAKHEGIWGGDDGDRVGGHAVCIAGREPGYKIISNSYGDEWGKYEDGTFKVRNSDVKHLGTCYIIFDVKDVVRLFKDVTSDSPNYDAIKTCKDAGIINGYEDGRFGPDDPISRAHMCEMFARFINLK